MLKVNKNLRTCVRYVGPLFDGVHAGEGFERDILAQHSGEVNASGLDEESSGGKHSGATVLELSSLEPGKSLITSNVGKIQWVEVLQRSSTSGLVGKTSMGNSTGNLL
jgi:hypothetical protein